ncbi:MAG: restriction endonuclease subunit S [Planctomycetes bacterium]|nr:restriction endonuclease subunit S [Planctomycetota bacterium]
MSFPRYPSYKASGVEWLGDVPAHWKVLAIKWLSPVRRGASPRPIDDPKYFDDDGEFAWVRIADVSASQGVLNETTQRLSELGSALSVRLTPGDLFVSIAGTVGKPCISGLKACIHDGFVYFPVLQIHPKFLYRVFEAETCYGGLGKWGTQLNLNTDTIGSIRVAVPPPEEASGLLAFLDRETAKIDALVAEQERLIELLKEKRQAVISHAVTKGLNPDAPMKPSGIEWLGEVPQHWTIERGRHLFRELSIPPELADGVVTAFRDGQVTLRENRRTDGFTLAVLEVGYQRVRSGDLVIHGMDAFAGAIGVSDSTGKCTPEYAVLTPVRQEIENEYFAAVLRLMAQRNFIVVMCPSVRERAPRFRFEAFKDVRLPVPPREEQLAIVRSIASLAEEAATLSREAQRSIDLLQERRTALISAAVTGQIDVRGIADTEAA